MQISFEEQTHIFWQFLLWLRPHTSTGMNIKDALLQYIMIMAIYCIIYMYFTAIEAKYTRIDTSIPVLQQLQTWIDTFIQLMLWKESKMWIGEAYLLTKEHAGSLGRNTLKN